MTLFPVFFLWLRLSYPWDLDANLTSSKNDLPWHPVGCSPQPPHAPSDSPPVHLGRFQHGTMYHALIWSCLFIGLLTSLLMIYLPPSRKSNTRSARTFPVLWLEHRARKHIMRSGFPDSSVGKESACNAGDLSWIPGLGRSPEEGKGYPLQYSGFENSMNRIVHGVTKSRTQLSDFHFTSLQMWEMINCINIKCGAPLFRVYSPVGKRNK